MENFLLRILEEKEKRLINLRNAVAKALGGLSVHCRDNELANKALAELNDAWDRSYLTVTDYKELEEQGNVDSK